MALPWILVVRCHMVTIGDPGHLEYDHSSVESEVPVTPWVVQAYDFTALKERSGLPRRSNELILLRTPV